MESTRFAFGLFEFDAATPELRREGVPTRLQAQPAQVLAYLVEHAGAVVSRDDLRNAVWGDNTFVDFEGSLNFCIAQVRSALQDNASKPIYIRTVPKSGYQFIAPVRRISAEPLKAEKADDALDVTEKVRNAPKGALDRRVAHLAFVLVVLAGIAVLGAYSRPGKSTNQSPIVAISRFDNETGNSGLSIVADALTDNVVEEMTAQSSNRYRVIGNAQILRTPREQRDLRTIASSLNASYVVLGQVQSNGQQVRILAHLIRLPDQTHIWVVRMDRPNSDILQLNSEIAHRIAAEFSARMATNPSQAASFPSETH